MPSFSTYCHSLQTNEVLPLTATEGQASSPAQNFFTRHISNDSSLPFGCKSSHAWQCGIKNGSVEYLQQGNQTTNVNGSLMYGHESLQQPSTEHINSDPSLSSGCQSSHTWQCENNNESVEYFQQGNQTGNVNGSLMYGHVSLQQPSTEHISSGSSLSFEYQPSHPWQCGNNSSVEYLQPGNQTTNVHGHLVHEHESFDLPEFMLHESIPPMQMHQLVEDQYLF